MEYLFIARQFPAFCTAWRVTELPEDVLRNFHVPWVRMVVHPDSKLDAEHPARHLSKLQEEAHGEPRIASKSSNVVSSGIAFAALDLITRPSPSRATMCSSVWKRLPRAQVPPLRHDSSRNLSSNSEHHRRTEWQEHSSMLVSLQPLIR